MDLSKLRFHGKINDDEDEFNAKEFELQCLICEVAESGSEPIATLNGFILEPGFYPKNDDDLGWEFLDSRSGHAGRALSILFNSPDLVDNILHEKAGTSEYRRFVYIERAWVDPAYRSKGLALRLMRETRHQFSEQGTLAILTAYPDGENITIEQRLKLAAYYLSDGPAGFKAISDIQYPGILMACWDNSVDLERSFANWEIEEP